MIFSPFAFVSSVSFDRKLALEFSSKPAQLPNAYVQPPATRSPHRATRTCVFRFGLPTGPRIHRRVCWACVGQHQLFILTNGHLSYLPAHVHGTYLTPPGFSRTAKQFPLCVSLCVRVCVCVKCGLRASLRWNVLFLCILSSSRAAAHPAQL